MSEQHYSPYVRAALDKKPQLAILEKVRGDDPFIPDAGSQKARDLLYVDPFSEVPNTPNKPLTLGEQPIPALSYQEMYTLAERYEQDQIIARKVRVNASALWAAQLSGTTAPDALEASLVRIDKIEERLRRYRSATGMSREALLRNREPFIGTSYRLPESLIERIEKMAVTRGDKIAPTVRFLLECGLILFDERCRRYEVWVLNQLKMRAEQAASLKEARQEKVEAVAEVFAEIEVDRYVDTKGPALERAQMIIDPMHGAPASVRELLRPGDAPRALSA